MNVVHTVKALIDQAGFTDLIFTRNKASEIRSKLPLSFWTNEDNQLQLCSILYVKAVGAGRKRKQPGVSDAPINVRTAVNGEMRQGYINKDTATEEQYQTYLDMLCEQGAAMRAQAKKYWRYGTKVRGFSLYLPFDTEDED